MGFKSLVIRGLKKLYAILYATNATKQLQTIKVDSNHEHHWAGEGSALAASHHIIYGLELVKNFWKNRNAHPRHQDFIGLPGGRFLEGTRVAVPQFKQ